jgi:hypothetical protein
MNRQTLITTLAAYRIQIQVALLLVIIAIMILAGGAPGGGSGGGPIGWPFF